MGESSSRSDQTRRIAQRIDVTYHRRPTWFGLWRRWLVVLTVLAGGAWAAAVAIASLTGHERWLNPGPVITAHAQFENNCTACHDGGGGLGRAKFSKAVSDAACLKCHDATPHGHGAAAEFVSMTGSAKQASNCTACHVEHRGRAVMVGASDQLCSQCHENLNSHLAAGRSLPVGFASHVTAFDLSHHPPFGRSLEQAGVPVKPPTTQKVSGGGPWLANLHLKFNHATHLDPRKVQATLVCSTCHVATRSDPRSLAAIGSMPPVNYDRNCRSCHALELEKGGLKVALPHAELAIAEAPLLDLSDAVRERLITNAVQLKAAAKGDEDQKAKDKTKDETPPDPIAKAVKQKTDEFFDGFADSVSAAYAKDAKRVKAEGKIKASDDRADQLDALGDLAAKDRAALAEFIAANKATTACAKCHEMAGDPDLLYALKVQWTTLKQFPAGVAEPQRLHTVPTGVTLQPRRWFASSRFDHEAHRDQSCTSCHAGMEKDNDDSFARLPGIESCVQCHHVDEARSRGASASCVTCHAYHPRG